MGFSTAVKNHSDKERWICIYPAYINSKRTVAEGRRIPKNKATENPLCSEMLETLTDLGLNACTDNKNYCRERNKEPCSNGRIRIQIKNDDGTPCNPKFPTRESLMVYISNNIPKIRARANRGSSDHHHSRSEQTKKKNKGGRR